MLTTTRGAGGCGELMIAANLALQQFDQTQRPLFAEMTTAFVNQMKIIRDGEEKILEICNQWLQQVNNTAKALQGNVDFLQERLTDYQARRNRGESSDSCKAASFDATDIGFINDMKRVHEEHLNFLHSTASRAIKLSEANFDPEKYGDIFKAIFSVRKQMLEEYGSLIKIYKETREAKFKEEIEDRKMKLKEQEAKFDQFMRKEGLALQREGFAFQREQAAEQINLQQQALQQQREANQGLMNYRQKKADREERKNDLVHEENMFRIPIEAKVAIQQARNARPPRQRGGCILQ